LDKPGFVNWWSPVREEEDGEFSQGVVFGCTGGGVPWDFSLEGEGDVFFEEGDAVFAGVGRGLRI
jgi:hypothetical protein